MMEMENERRQVSDNSLECSKNVENINNLNVVTDETDNMHRNNERNM